MSAQRPHASSLSPLARLGELLRFESQDIIVVTTYAVAVGLLSLIISLAVQTLVGAMAFMVALQPRLILTLIVLAALSFTGVLRALKAPTIERIRQRIFMRTSLEIAHRMPRVAANGHPRATLDIDRRGQVRACMGGQARRVVDGLRIPFVGLDALIANKRSTKRVKDALDVEVLSQLAKAPAVRKKRVAKKKS